MLHRLIDNNLMLLYVEQCTYLCRQLHGEKKEWLFFSCAATPTVAIVGETKDHMLGAKKLCTDLSYHRWIHLSVFLVCADWTFLTRCWDSSWTQWSQNGQRSYKEVEGTASAQVLKPHYTEEDDEELLHRQSNILQNARSHKILKYYGNSLSSYKCVQCITIFNLDLKTNIKKHFLLWIISSKRFQSHSGLFHKGKILWAVTRRCMFAFSTTCPWWEDLTVFTKLLECVCGSFVQLVVTITPCSM
jgi:hypothetical protein